MDVSSSPANTDLRSPSKGGLGTVFVTGDLNVDHVATNVVLGGITRVAHNPPTVGGSALNAAFALRAAGFHSVVFGKVGADADGDHILSALSTHQIQCFVNRHNSRPTGSCNIIYFEGEKYPRTIYYACGNANDYEIDSLDEALRAAALTQNDFVFSPLHLYDQTDGDRNHCRAFFHKLRSSGARVIVDVVPHGIYELLDAMTLVDIIGGPVFVMIGEYRTFMNLTAACADDMPTQADCDRIAQHFESTYFLCRFGIGNISRELVFRRTATGADIIEAAAETGYESLPDVEKRGFGDRLTASTLKRILETSER